MTVKTFPELFTDDHKVVIPMIQRDYAQGRTDPRSAAVLAVFLDVLYRALTEPASEAVDLDFVYGRWDDASRTLEPLDGQQRLTTLFLLHWFLAQQDGRQAEFRAWMQTDRRSRFRYRTRPSAEEFIDALVNEDVDIATLPEGEHALATWLADRSWFLRAWHRDPTVSGCLSALTAISARFRGLNHGFDILTDRARPRVRFHDLRLSEFGLSDDLYVKMNARGKSLTSFEVFKAELEQFVEAEFAQERCPHDERMSWKEYVSHQFDGSWTDFLWCTLDGGSPDLRGGIDARFMQLLRLAMLIHCVLRRPPGEDELEPQMGALLTVAEPSVRFVRDTLGGLDRAFVKRLVVLFNAISGSRDGKLGVLGRTDYFDEDAAFEALFAPPGKGRFGSSTADWAKLASYGMFLLARADDLRSEAGRAACHEWMRVVCNLVNNSDVDRLERLVGALQSIASVHELGASNRFLTGVADPQVLRQGFSREQRDQERVKALLISSGTGWREVIEGAEAHTYLRGDLRFVLRASPVWDTCVTTSPDDWQESQHQRLQEALTYWYDRVCAVFPADGAGRVALGEAQEEQLWERALLCHGDYLLPSRKNRCLIHDGDRDPSWKGLLQAKALREVVQAVFGEIDPNDVAESLRKIIREANTKDMPLWRRWLIREPRLITACAQRMLRFEDETVYLLQTTQRNGYHADLYLYALYFVATDLDLQGVDQPRAPRVRGGGGPSTLTLVRSRRGGRMAVTTEGKQQVFRVEAGSSWGEAVDHAGWRREGDEYVRRVPLERGEAELLVLLDVLGEAGESAVT